MNKLKSWYEKSLWRVNGSKNKILKISVASLDLFYHCSVICYNEIFLSPMKRFLLIHNSKKDHQRWKIPSEMEVAPRYNYWHCWHCWHCSTLLDTVDMTYNEYSFHTHLSCSNFSNRKDQLRAEMPFGKWLSHGCLGVFSNWLSKRVSKSIF